MFIVTLRNCIVCCLHRFQTIEELGEVTFLLLEPGIPGATPDAAELC